MEKEKLATSCNRGRLYGMNFRPDVRFAGLTACIEWIGTPLSAKRKTSFENVNQEKEKVKGKEKRTKSVNCYPQQQTEWKQASATPLLLSLYHVRGSLRSFTLFMAEAIMQLFFAILRLEFIFLVNLKCYRDAFQ